MKKTTDAELDSLANRPQPVGYYDHAVATLMAELQHQLQRQETTLDLIRRVEYQMECHQKTVEDAELKALEVRRALKVLIRKSGV